MFTKLFRKEAPAPAAAPLGQIPHTQPGSLADLRRQLYDAVGQDVVMVRFLDGLCDRLWEVAYGFPASEKDHHTGKTGLIEHSLGVAVRMAVAFRGTSVNVQVAAILAGMGHDLGKMTSWVVDTRGMVYSPFYDSLLNYSSWILTAQRDGFGYKESPQVSSTLVQRLLPPGFYNSGFYDPAEYALACEAMARHHDAGDRVAHNRYLKVLVEVDGDDASQEKEVSQVAAAGGEDKRDQMIIDEFRKGFLTLTGDKHIRYGFGYCYVDDQFEGVCAVLHESVFFREHKTGGSVVQYLREKKNLDLAQDGLIDVLRGKNLICDIRRGSMYLGDVPCGDGTANWYFFDATYFLNPVPADRHPINYRKFVEAPIEDAEEMEPEEQEF